MESLANAVLLCKFRTSLLLPHRQCPTNCQVQGFDVNRQVLQSELLKVLQSNSACLEKWYVTVDKHIVLKSGVCHSGQTRCL